MTENTLVLPGMSGNAGALMAFSRVAEDSGLQPFPVTLVKDGTFKTHSLVPADIKDLLPDGSKPITAIFITYRFGVVAWQVGYDHRSEENKAPVYMAYVPGSDGPSGNLLCEAAKAYQFTKKDDKVQYDFVTSQVGHIQPLIEALVYLPALNNLGVISTGSNYGAVEETVAVIKSLCQRKEDGTFGDVPQVPMLISPMVAHKHTKNWDWDIDYIGMSHAPANETTMQAITKFKAWAATANEDVATASALEMWLTCSDRPMTTDIKASLQKAVNLVPRARRG